jgi:hypothetical protein
LGAKSRENVVVGGRANGAIVAIAASRQYWQVWRDKRPSLRGGAAERALIATMARWRMFGRSLIVADLDAELRCVAKLRFELGGDRKIVSPGRNALCESRRRNGGEELNE